MGGGFEPVDMERQRGEQSLRQRGDFGRDAETRHVGQMQHAEHNEQQKQKRRDARKADAIEDRRAHPRERPEASQRSKRNQEAGDGEEDGNAVAAIKKEEMVDPARKQRCETMAAEGKMDVDVQQNDGKDGYAAKQIDAI